uniref:Copper transport protein n=1 Tax=Ganoderma boninense TaxID=34458 RepID=A0A5K1K908_9APHY|nr:Mitogen-activated protein kinase (EC [Ganoderma boninense]
MDMSMASMSMTATAAAASATSTGMSMSMDMGGSCKISMLWNWYTVNACFISSTWQVTSKGAFAGSCIGVIFLVIVLEGLRRFQREFDRYLHRANGASSTPPQLHAEDQSDTASRKGLNTLSSSALGRRSSGDQLKLWQHLLRSALFMVQFAVGYFVMLLAMYYNGYIIICIFIGAFLGASIFQWDTYHGEAGPVRGGEAFGALLRSSNLPEVVLTTAFPCTMFNRLSAFLLWAMVLFPVFAVGQESNVTTPKNFGILLFPAFEPLDVFGPAEVLQALSRGRQISLYLISNGNTTDPVSTAPASAAMNAHNSSAFQSVVPTHTLATAPADLEVLLIPGGLGTRSPDLNATIDWVRATYPSLHSLVSVCTGGSVAARAGLFDGRRATTNKVSWDAMTVYGTNVTWDKGARWVQDGNVWSSGGVSAAIDVTLGFVAHTWGEDVARGHGEPDRE